MATIPDGAPRVLRLRPARAVVATTALLTLGLTACGLMDSGRNETQSPVVIPTAQPVSPSAEASQSTTAVSPSDGVSGTGATSSVLADAPPPGSTVTTTDVIVQRQTKIRVRTATRTLPAVTVTPPPVTRTTTDTKTDTHTITQTLISVLPAKTISRTRTVTKTVTRTRTIRK